MSLVRSFMLSTKAGKQAWVEPVIEPGADRVRFTVKTGAGKPREGTVSRRGAICISCNTPVPLDYIRAEGQAKRMGAQLMAVVADGRGGRVHLPPIPEHEAIAAQAKPEWEPDTELIPNSRHMTPVIYGMTTHADLFTSRQLVALTTFSDLVGEVRQRAERDALTAERVSQAKDYANAIATYLAFVVSRSADWNSSLCRWETIRQLPQQVFARSAMPMTWDYAEANPFSESAGSFNASLINVGRSIVGLSTTSSAGKPGRAVQHDAGRSDYPIQIALACTDPPYYDNVPYADLSDFFYLWLRRSLGGVYPDLFGTMLVPKAQELISDPFRQGGKEASRKFFEEGMSRAFGNLRSVSHPDYPMTVFYAFKQSESEQGDEAEVDLVPAVSSTGWETMLQGLIDAGLQVTGTWPMRTEMATRMRSLDSNALASSIVLVCRPRLENAPVATRREFLTALRRELEDALLHMMHGNVAPVDLAQATIGPGMAVYSRYSKVIETDGSPLRVRTALQIINQELDTILSAQEGDYDTDTRFCLAWFEQFGMSAAPFGEADVMARAKNTSVQGLHDAGVLEARAGRVRLLKREEYPADWNPQKDARKPVWECTQQLVRALQEQGESGAARLCAELGSAAEPARDLAYRLYSICERKGWAQEALAYNSLVMAWTEITRLASSPAIHEPQAGLFAE